MVSAANAADSGPTKSRIIRSRRMIER
jgi:hypothetical protein